VARVGEKLPRDVSVQIRSSPRDDDDEGGKHFAEGTREPNGREAAWRGRGFPARLAGRRRGVRGPTTRPGAPRLSVAATASSPEPRGGGCMWR